MKEVMTRDELCLGMPYALGYTGSKKTLVARLYCVRTTRYHFVTEDRVLLMLRFLPTETESDWVVLSPAQHQGFVHIVAHRPSIDADPLPFSTRDMHAAQVVAAAQTHQPD